MAEAALAPAEGLVTYGCCEEPQEEKEHLAPYVAEFVGTFILVFTFGFVAFKRSLSGRCLRNQGETEEKREKLKKNRGKMKGKRRFESRFGAVEAVPRSVGPTGRPQLSPVASR